MSIFSNRLEQTRKRAGWTKTYTAKKLKLPLTTYANYEYGAREPDINTITAISNLFKTTTDYLMGKTNNPSPTSTNNEITDSDLNDMINNARFFDGKPIDDHDKELVRGILKRIYNEK